MKEEVVTEGAGKAQGLLSQAITVNGFIYISGLYVALKMEQ